MNSFARLFIQPEQVCYAEVSQLLNPDHPVPMQCPIVSYLEQDWILAVPDRTPIGVAILWRSSRKLWVSQPQMQPEELWQTHLTLRHPMTTDLGI